MSPFIKILTKRLWGKLLKLKQISLCSIIVVTIKVKEKNIKLDQLRKNYFSVARNLLVVRQYQIMFQKFSNFFKTYNWEKELF